MNLLASWNKRSNRSSLIGKRVVGEINVGCGQCALCRAGDPRHCPARTVLGIKGRDGAHAECLRLPTVNLIEVPDSISDAAAVFVEPLAAAYGISELVDIAGGYVRRGDRRRQIGNTVWTEFVRIDRWRDHRR